MHLTPYPHQPNWVVVETIGRVETSACSICGKTKTRVK